MTKWRTIHWFRAAKYVHDWDTEADARRFLNIIDPNREGSADVDPVTETPEPVSFCPDSSLAAFGAASLEQSP